MICVSSNDAGGAEILCLLKNQNKKYILNLSGQLLKFLKKLKFKKTLKN